MRSPRGPFGCISTFSHEPLRAVREADTGRPLVVCIPIVYTFTWETRQKIVARMHAVSSTIQAGAARR